VTFREKLIANCTAKAKELGRRLTSMEIVEAASALHETASKARRKSEIVPAAESIYELYPRKVGKEDALLAITGALRKHEAAYLLDKTSQFAEAVRSWPSSYRYMQDGGDRCPNPGTWYRQGRFADDVSTWRRRGAHTPAPHQKVSPPEPAGWRDAFPEFVDRDKPWHDLDTIQQTFLINNTATAAHFSEPVEQDDDQTRLRQA